MEINSKLWKYAGNLIVKYEFEQNLNRNEVWIKIEKVSEFS